MFKKKWEFHSGRVTVYAGISFKICKKHFLSLGKQNFKGRKNKETQLN